MKKNLKKLITRSLLPISAAFALLAANDASAGSVTPKRELRSTWFTTHVNIDWPSTKGTTSTIVNKQKEDMIDYIEKFARMNLNGACFQVRAQSDAVYKSSYEPWSAVISGTRGKDPGWDPLLFCIDECHKRGLECYAWINPFRWSTGTDYSTDTDKMFKANGWILSYGGYYVLNPAIPEAREHILKVCREIVTNYAIDGVLFDDYFYPNNIPENSTAGDWNLYKSSGTSMSIGDWRRENINIFVREFKKMIEEVHPDMRFGISPAGVAGSKNTSAGKYGVTPNPAPAGDWQYNTIYSDPLAWVSEGSIDFISPQIYWKTDHATAPYEPLCDWWTYIGDHFGRHFYSSHSVSFLSSSNRTADWEEVATQVRLNRKYAQATDENSPGSIYFSSKYFYGPAVSGLGDYLLNNVYQTKCLVPKVTWKNVPTFGAPADLTFDGTNLKWTKINAPRSIMRYTVYAVPLSVNFDNAMESDGDGISNDYLVNVCYDNKFELDPTLRSGYWYAVCGYDGLGNEFEPAVVNYPSGESAKVTLLSPADNATATWAQKFEWSKVDKGEYSMRISKTDDFTDIVYTSTRDVVTGVFPDMSVLEPKTRYYWNVMSFQPDKISAVSETRSFTTSDYADAPTVNLLTPADGVDVEGDIDFSWTAAQGCDSYTLEIATSAGFDKIHYTATTDKTSLKVNPSLLGRGKFFWRVRAEGALLYASVSATRGFEISTIAIGESEPGYIIKNDPAVYPEVEKVKIENLWMRSVDGGFKNITFENNGMLERGMVALGDYVYLTRRSENSQGATIFLEKYDGMTGEHIASIELSDNGRVLFYPNNSVARDDAGHLVIGNLTTNIQVNPLYLHQVDLTTGELREIAKISPANISTVRVDHFNVTGDVEKGDFTVYFAMASGTQLVRMNYEGGELKDTKIAKFDTFYPADRASFAIAAFVSPISYDEVLVNGGGITLGLYNFATGKLTDHVGNCREASHGATNANGSARFVLDKHYYTVYPSTAAESGFKFEILRGADAKMSSASLIATIPAIGNGLGTVESTTSSTPISYVKDSESKARLYVYAAGNGISAYRISENNSSSASIVASSGTTVSVNGNTVVFSSIVDDCAVYTLTGALVANDHSTDSITVPAPGQYIVIVDGVSCRVAVRR